MSVIHIDNWNYDTAAHLLARAGFGHKGGYSKKTGEVKEVRKLADKTPEEAVDFVMKYKGKKSKGPGKNNGDDDLHFKLQRWWYKRMWKQSKPLGEKVTLFYHHLFATARDKVSDSSYMAFQNRLLRLYSRGNFKALVKQINIDPAMLWWLDGRDNRITPPTYVIPNENYGRELWELFTLGTHDFAGNPNYTEDDIKQAARALSGWRTEEIGSSKVSSYFRNSRHDQNDKVIFAGTANEQTITGSSDETVGMLDHEALVDITFAHLDTDGRPTVARYIVRQFWAFFAYEPDVDLANGTGQQDLAMIDALVDVFTTNDYEIAPLLRAMFLRPEFYLNTGSRVKTPVEYTTGVLRTLKGKMNRETQEHVVNQLMPQMGQELMNPPSVFSWPTDLEWVSSQTLLNRYEFARDLGESWDLKFNAIKFITKKETLRSQVVDAFLTVLGLRLKDYAGNTNPEPLRIDTDTYDELIAMLGPDDGETLTAHLKQKWWVYEYVNPMVNMMLTLPEYQVHTGPLDPADLVS